MQFDFPDEKGKPYKSSGGKMVYNELLKREIPVGWEVKRLGEVCDFRNGINYDKNEIGNKSYKIVNVRNISAEKIDKLSSCLQNRVTLLQEIQKARSIKDLPIVASFNISLKSYDNKSDFKEFLKEKYQEAIDNNSFKKELLSFYLFGLNSKDEKDFEKKIKNILIHEHGIENFIHER